MNRRDGILLLLTDHETVSSHAICVRMFDFLSIRRLIVVN